jgi:hypothetical protein
MLMYTPLSTKLNGSEVETQSEVKPNCFYLLIFSWRHALVTLESMILFVAALIKRITLFK